MFANRLEMIERRSTLLLNFRQRRGYLSEIYSRRACDGTNLHSRLMINNMFLIFYIHLLSY